jgi:excisionase family DNA binding protein
MVHPANAYIAPIRIWHSVNSVKPIHDVESNMNLSEDKDPGFPTDPLWTVEDVAAYLKLQPETIRSMARRGELPAIKFGKVWRFQKYAIHDMLVNMY